MKQTSQECEFNPCSHVSHNASNFVLRSYNFWICDCGGNFENIGMRFSSLYSFKNYPNIEEFNAKKQAVRQPSWPHTFNILHKNKFLKSIIRFYLILKTASPFHGMFNEFLSGSKRPGCLVSPPTNMALLLSKKLWKLNWISNHH